MAFSAWAEQYEEAQQQKRMLAGAAQRMLRPALFGCFRSWREDWKDAERVKEARGWEGKLSAALTERDNLLRELKAVREQLMMFTGDAEVQLTCGQPELEPT